MNDLILIKSGTLGAKTEMPRLNEDEMGYVKDKKALYIGTREGNVRLCGADDIQALTDRIKALEEKLTVSETPIT